MSTKNNNKLKVAHRGESDTCPENTLLAFNAAWDNNADICEGDFHLTKDKIIVCIHDPDTLRVAGKNLVISQSTYKELQELNVAHYFDPSLTEQIPTLEQVLDTVPGAGSFLIDIKSGVEIIPQLMSILSNIKLTKFQFGVISFNKEVLRQVKQHDGQIITLLLNDSKDKMTNANIKETLLDINANGLLTNIINPDLKDEVESLKLIYDIWSSDPGYTPN